MSKNVLTALAVSAFFALPTAALAALPAANEGTAETYADEVKEQPDGKEIGAPSQGAPLESAQSGTDTAAE